MTAKHVELNPIMATFISILNDTIGHKVSRSKAKDDPSNCEHSFSYFSSYREARAMQKRGKELVQYEKNF